jgi:hypothetical protein
MDASPAYTDIPRWQFSLRQLFAVVLFLCLGLGVFSLWMNVIVESRRRSDENMRVAMTLAQLWKGMQSYHVANAHYPPAHLVDAEDRPVHSWRVVVTPYLDWQGFYDAYDFAEPWNGPGNSRLHEIRGMEFSARPLSRAKGHTDFVLITGPGTAFPGAATTSSAEFTDGLQHTIVATETAHSGIFWLAPGDLDVTRYSFKVNERSQLAISNPYGRAPCVVFADGHTERIGETISPQALGALTTIAGSDGVAQE